MHNFTLNYQLFSQHLICSTAHNLILWENRATTLKLMHIMFYDLNRSVSEM